MADWDIRSKVKDQDGKYSDGQPQKRGDKLGSVAACEAHAGKKLSWVPHGAVLADGGVKAYDEATGIYYLVTQGRDAGVADGPR